MTDSLLEQEPLVRGASFLAVLLVMTIWESVTPRRRLAIPRRLRWPSNLGIVVIDTVLIRLTFPILAVGLARFAEEHGWGLLNIVEVPTWIAVILALLALDLTIYLQHVMFHALPALWRLHRMHHADLEFDVTTALRFHPIEILLSMGIKLAAVAALGPPAVAVLIFEILLNATAMFNHGNVRIPVQIDCMLRWIIVTPDMHRVHHSIIRNETNSDFGFNLPWWDRLFGTYRAQPAAGHDGMTIGTEEFRTPRDLRIDQLLIQPFRGRSAGYALDQNKHQH